MYRYTSYITLQGPELILTQLRRAYVINSPIGELALKRMSPTSTHI